MSWQADYVDPWTKLRTYDIDETCTPAMQGLRDLWKSKKNTASRTDKDYAKIDAYVQANWDKFKAEDVGPLQFIVSKLYRTNQQALHDKIDFLVDDLQY